MPSMMLCGGGDRNPEGVIMDVFTGRDVSSGVYARSNIMSHTTSILWN